MDPGDARRGWKLVEVVCVNRRRKRGHVEERARKDTKMAHVGADLTCSVGPNSLLVMHGFTFCLLLLSVLYQCGKKVNKA